MAKPYQSNIRYSEEVKKVIEEQPGDSFADKFEKLIMECKKSEPERKARIKALDREIQEKEAKVRSLAAKINSAQSVLNFVEQVKSRADTLKGLMGEYSTSLERSINNLT